jgi:membrane protease YdiL (CAAX protease family)
MSLFVWVLWKVLGRGEESPRAVWFVCGIVLSSLLFGIGHLPVAKMIAGELTVPLVTYVIAANSIFGIAAGFLYWFRGLEASIIAHICAHVVLLAGINMT